MRFSAIIPVLLGLGALVLSFLCLFAGSTVSFLPTYDIINLNTSELGYTVASNNNILSSINPEIASFLESLPDSVTQKLEDEVNTLARELGVHDFYSFNVMTYCEGYYEPTPKPNATVKLDDIDRNFTACSNRTAMFQFDPRQVIQRELDEATDGKVNITDLQWPSSIDQGINTLHTVQRATFVLYCLAIGLIGVATIIAIISILFSGRLSAFLNVLVSALAFLAIGLASALVTAVAVKGVDLINKYGEQVGVQASRGGKFLALTWAATAAMLICILWWFVDCCVGRRGHRRSRHAEKSTI